MWKVPAHDRVPADPSVEVKERARAAWIDAKSNAANLVPPAVADRLWINGLAAVEVAPARVRVVMLHRLETTFRLLVDQGRWSSLGAAVASSVAAAGSEAAQAHGAPGRGRAQ
jgi:hypothetical protein